jgi:hypothetical protein
VPLHRKNDVRSEILEEIYASHDLSVSVSSFFDDLLGDANLWEDCLDRRQPAVERGANSSLARRQPSAAREMVGSGELGRE